MSPKIRVVPRCVFSRDDGRLPIKAIWVEPNAVDLPIFPSGLGETR